MGEKTGRGEIRQENAKQAAPAAGRAGRSPAAFSPAGRAVFLQRTIGNQAVQRLFRAGLLQPKLKIGAPNDVYEQEADRVADQVMRMPEPAIQRKPG